MKIRPSKTVSGEVAAEPRDRLETIWISVYGPEACTDKVQTEALVTDTGRARLPKLSWEATSDAILTHVAIWDRSGRRLRLTIPLNPGPVIQQNRGTIVMERSEVEWR